MPTHRSSGVAVIAQGDSLSSAISPTSASSGLLYLTLCGIDVPSGWDAAAITFAVSRDGVTYVPLYDKDGEVTIPASVVAASRAYSLDPATFVGWCFVKVRSGTAASPVVQTGARSIGYTAVEVG